jgi:hypothetical protein
LHDAKVQCCVTREIEVGQYTSGLSVGIKVKRCMNDKIDAEYKNSKMCA